MVFLAQGKGSRQYSKATAVQCAPPPQKKNKQTQQIGSSLTSASAHPFVISFDFTHALCNMATDAAKRYLEEVVPSRPEFKEIAGLYERRCEPTASPPSF